MSVTDTNTRARNVHGSVKAGPLMPGHPGVLKGTARFSPVSLGVVLLIHILLLAVLLHLVQDVPPVITPETPMMVNLLSEIPTAPIIEQQEPQPPKPQPVHRQKPMPKPVQVVKETPVPLPQVLENSPPSQVETPASTETKPSVVAEAAPAPIKAPEVAEKPAPKEVVVESVSGIAYLYNPKPAYPRMSVRAKEQGLVLFKVLVNSSGVPDSVEMIKSSGFERLDHAALEAVKQWRFVPVKRNNQAISVYANVPVNFSLVD